MPEAMTFEFLITFSVLALSVLSLIGSALAVRLAETPPRRKVDVERSIQNAPYHRLHNIVTIRQR